MSFFAYIFLGFCKFTENDFITETFIERRDERYDIVPGLYTKIEDVLSQINQESKVINFTFENERVKANFKDDDSEYITLREGFKYVLGFEKDLIDKTMVAKYAPHMRRGLFAIFIYSNVCGYSHVGDSVVPLLNVISMPQSQVGEIVSVDVNDPMYIPVSAKMISEIEIKLCSDTGEELPFEGDSVKTIISLHFRKVRIN